MIRILIILLMACPFLGKGQTFNTTLNYDGYGEVCTSVILDSTSYYFVGGCLEEDATDNNSLFELFKTNQSGLLIDSLLIDFDSLRYSGRYNSNKVVFDKKDNMWIAGVLRNDITALQRGIILKIQNFQITPQIYLSQLEDSFEINSSLFLIGNNLYVVGSTSHGSNGSNDYLIQKLDTNIILKQDTNFGGLGRELIGNAIQFQDKIVMSGVTNTNAAMHPYFATLAPNAQFLCIDTNFNLIWENTIVTTGADFAPIIQEHGFFYYTLEIPNSFGFRYDLRHVYGQLDLNNGDILWMDTLELQDEIIFPGNMESIDSTSFVIMCKIEKAGYPFDLTQIIKFNSSGEKQWERIYYDGNVTNNELNSMQVDYQGFLVFGGGYYNTITNSSDVWALKLDPNGCLDNNDCGIVTGILDLTPPKDQFNLKIYPNPAQDFVQIIVENTGGYKNENLKLDIYDLNGKLVYNSSLLIHGQIPIFKADVSHLSTGTYFIQSCINGIECGTTPLVIK
jgi:hypothetical protein